MIASQLIRWEDWLDTGCRETPDSITFINYNKKCLKPKHFKLVSEENLFLVSR